MSKVTTIYDQILVKLAALYPTKTRIPNAYSLIDNPKTLLRDGYGLIIGPASFEPFEFCNFMVNRSVSVALTKEMHRLDTATAETDTTVKSLLESVYQVQKLFYAYSELDIEASIAKVDLGQVSGIETFYNDKQNFISMTVEFNFFVSETL